MPVTLVNAYCTEDQIRAEMRDAISTVPTDLIHKAINAASRGIDDYCSGDVPQSRRFYQDTTATARTFITEQTDFAFIDDFSTKTGLIVKTDEDNDGIYENTWTINTDFVPWPLNADAEVATSPMAFWKIIPVGSTSTGTTLVGRKRFPIYDRRAGLQVTAKWGWPGIPKQIEEACILRTMSLLLRKDSPLGVIPNQQWGALKLPTFDPDVGAMLRPFVKRRPWSMSYYSDQANFSLFHRRAR